MKGENQLSPLLIRTIVPCRIWNLIMMGSFRWFYMHLKYQHLLLKVHPGSQHAQSTAMNVPDLFDHKVEQFESIDWKSAQLYADHIKIGVHGRKIQRKESINDSTRPFAVTSLVCWKIPFFNLVTRSGMFYVSVLVIIYLPKLHRWILSPWILSNKIMRDSEIFPLWNRIT